MKHCKLGRPPSEIRRVSWTIHVTPATREKAERIARDRLISPPSRVIEALVEKESQIKSDHE